MTYLADLDERGELITCGTTPAVLVIACFVGSMLGVVAWGWLLIRVLGTSDSISSFMLSFMLFIVGTIAIAASGFFLAAYLTQGSCS